MSLVAKLEGNSLKFTTLPPRARCFSRLINRAACISPNHLYMLSIVEIRSFLPLPQISRLFSFLPLISFYLILPHPVTWTKTAVSGPAQRYTGGPDRYRMWRSTVKIALPIAINIDRCSCSPFVGGMFHAILKLHCEPLADLTWPRVERYSGMENLSPLLLLDRFVACCTPPDSRSMLFAIRYTRCRQKRYGATRDSIDA